MRILKTFVLLLTLFAFVQETSNAQRTRTGTNNNRGQATELKGNKQFDWGRVFIGGNLGGSGLSFSNGGNSTINIQLSPIVGYRVTERFSAGVGPIFNYYKRGGFDGNAIWGTRVLARYDILPQFFLSSEYSNIWFKCDYINNATFETIEVTESIRSFPIGGGYRQRMAGRSSFVAELMYDVLYKADGGTSANDCFFDPGTGLVYRIGVNVGF